MEGGGISIACRDAAAMCVPPTAGAKMHVRRRCICALQVTYRRDLAAAGAHWHNHLLTNSAPPARPKEPTTGAALAARSR